MSSDATVAASSFSRASSVFQFGIVNPGSESCVLKDLCDRIADPNSHRICVENWWKDRSKIRIEYVISNS